MGNKFRFKFYTGMPLHEPATFKILWQLLSDPVVQATRWGRVERTNEPFTEDWKTAHAVLRTVKMVFVSGAGDGFQLMIQRWESLYSISLWIKLAAMSKLKRRREWLGWMARFVEAGPALFGHGESIDEYDTKHLVETEGSRGWIGTSVAELSEFLPGVYWMTVFGPQLVERLQLAELPGVEVRRLRGPQVMLVLDEPPVPASMPERLERERQIAERLGGDHFFDRDTPERPRRQVPAFAEELARLQRTPVT